MTTQRSCNINWNINQVVVAISTGEPCYDVLVMINKMISFIFNYLLIIIFLTLCRFTKNGDVLSGKRRVYLPFFIVATVYANNN